MVFRKISKLDSDKNVQLHESLKQLSQENISEAQKNKMKEHLFLSIEQSKQAAADKDLLPIGLQKLVWRIQDFGKEMALSFNEQIILKEKVFARIEDSMNSSYNVKPFRYLKTVLSSVLLLFFVVTAVIVFPFQVPLTLAAHQTYLDFVNGQVFVLRSGQLIPGVKSFTLKEGDVLLTKNDSSASIRFFDDSVSRLDANTQVEIKRIYAEPFNPVATQVELNLQEGRLWTRVLNLVDDRSHFVVSTDQASALVSKKAAFDIQTHASSQTTITVFDNVVDFSLSRKNNGSTETKPVLAGFNAEVSESDAVHVAQISITTSSENNISSSWIQGNLERDELHDQSVTAEKEHSFETTEQTSITPVVDKTMDTGTALSNPDLEKLRLDFIDSYHNLSVSEASLVHQDKDAKIDLTFKDTVKNILDQAAVFEKDDPLNTGLLKSFMEAKISEQKKNLTTFLPWDSLYPAKDLIDQTELLLSDDNISRTLLQLSQAEAKLLELQDLIQKNNLDQASQLLVRYKDQLDQITLMVDSSNADKINSQVNELLEQQLDQIKILTFLEQSLVTSKSDLLLEVRNVRHTILVKLMGAVKDLKSQVPDAFLKELRDLLKTYLSANEKYDEDFVTLLNILISNNKEQSGTDLTVNPPVKLPVDLGLVTIVKEQGTQEITPLLPVSTPL